ncbi:MAG: hypothetical protein IPP47_02980 [Bryobacterales bacterium]|nr:hypothetical protein [Bryobacterales bacterium]
MNRLESWKEIAEFFNVSVRTVQGWEVEKALPVHRNPGARGRVWAEEAELRAWLAAQESTPPPEPARPTRRYLLPGLLVGGLVVIALLAFFTLRRPAGMPASVKTEGLSLVAFDDQGAELWRQRLPFEHHALTTPSEVEHLRPTFLDLTGDGKPEVLFPLRGHDQRSQNSLLLCFSHDGRLLWQFEPGRVMQTPKETHPRIYLLRAMAPVSLKPGAPPHLALVSAQSPNFIAQVALLDSGGHLVREYWHSGHFSSVDARDLDGDGTPEIVLAGLSNSYNTATLVVLDPTRMSGASKETSRDYQLLGQADPVERARLLFARTQANLFRQKYNYGHGVLFAPDHLIVMVHELTSDRCGVSVNYHLAFNMELRDVEIADMSKNCYQTLYAARLMPKLLDPQDELPELRKIRVLTPWH